MTSVTCYMGGGNVSGSAECQWKMLANTWPNNVYLAHLLSLARGQTRDDGTRVINEDGGNPGEHLLKVLLQPGDVLRVTDYLKQVFVTNKVEPVEIGNNLMFLKSMKFKFYDVLFSVADIILWWFNWKLYTMTCFCWKLPNFSNCMDRH